VAGASGSGSASVRPQAPTRAEARDATQAFLGSPAAKGGSGGSGPGGSGHRRPFPRKRVVALYGSPAMSATIIGRKSVKGAKRKLHHQARPYDRRSRHTVPAFDLVVVLATADPGPDHNYRQRYHSRVIKPYLHAARQLNGRLILDIQPGRSRLLTEVKAYREWLARPDVDLALDAEWNLGPHERPGDPGSVGARELNGVSRYLEGLAERQRLPAKLMIVHQFRKGSVHHKQRIKGRHKVQVTLDFDGIGSRPAKQAGYEKLSSPTLFDGFMLFYRLDDRLMSPKQVLHLDPKPDLVEYQ
jgi:hypothetical protein